MSPGRYRTAADADPENLRTFATSPQQAAPHPIGRRPAVARPPTHRPPPPLPAWELRNFSQLPKTGISVIHRGSAARAAPGQPPVGVPESSGSEASETIPFPGADSIFSTVAPPFPGNFRFCRRPPLAPRSRQTETPRSAIPRAAGINIERLCCFGKKFVERLGNGATLEVLSCNSSPAVCFTIICSLG